MKALHPSQLEAGTVVYVRVQVGVISVRHVGLVTDRRDANGLPTVISASKRRGYTHEESWNQFTEGTRATIVPMPAGVSPAEMLRRARADIGTRWDLVSANCEHAVARWRGLPEESGQLRSSVAVFAVLGLIIAAARL